MYIHLGNLCYLAVSVGEINNYKAVFTGNFIDLFLYFTGFYSAIIRINDSPQCILELLKRNGIQNVCTGSV